MLYLEEYNLELDEEFVLRFECPHRVYPVVVLIIGVVSVGDELNGAAGNEVVVGHNGAICELMRKSIRLLNSNFLKLSFKEIYMVIFW